MEILILDSTTKTITGVLGDAITTDNPEFTVHYADNDDNSFTEGSEDGTFNGTNSITLCSAPAES